MEGFVDFHAHILPHMDDGSECVEVSLGLGQALARQGISVVCATSHFYRNRQSVQQFLACRQAAWEALRHVWTPDLPSVLLGAEVAFFQGIGDCLELDSLCLEGTKTLLLEMPFSVWCDWELEEVIHLVLDREYQIILAHPERYCFNSMNRRNLEKLAQLPLRLQINADTVLRWQTRKTGVWLLHLQGNPVLGSDCHNLSARSPHLAQARDVIRKKLGVSFLREMDCGMWELLPAAFQ